MPSLLDPAVAQVEMDAENDAKNDESTGSPTSVLKEEDKVNIDSADPIPETVEIETESSLLPRNIIEEEEKLLEARLKEEDTKHTEETAHLNNSQFKKLDELLTQTQLYAEFLLDKMDDITINGVEQVDEGIVGKKRGRGAKRKATYNDRKAKRAVAAMLTRSEEGAGPEDMNLTEEERVAKGQSELVPLLSGGKLKPYQLKGIKWLISLWQNGLNGILADQMGLGKTIQTIGFLAHLKGKGLDGPYLIIAPLSTLSNWVNEIQRFTPSINAIVYHGDKKERDELRRKHMPKTIGPKFPFIITSYEVAMNDARKCLRHYNWKYLVVDEGHRLKNSKCKLLRELKYLPVENKLLLTGTPLQNNLSELWSLLNFILPDIFSSHDEFESWFDLSGKCNNEAMREEMEERRRVQVVAKLHAILRPFLLRRMKSDVEHMLPRKKEIILYANMTDHQRSFQDHLVNQTLEGHLLEKNHSMAGMKGKLNNLMIQLRKNCNHPDLLESAFNGSYDYPPVEEIVGQCGKFRLLDRLLGKLFARKHKVLIFTQWTKILDIMEYYFGEKGFEVCRIDGSVKLEERRRQIAEFNDVNSNFRIFLLSTRAGGLGINLTSADTCILYDSDWNPQMDLQAMDRCHRIGQTKPVHVYRLATALSVEGRILKRAFSKLKLEHVVIGKGQFQQERPKPSLVESLEEEDLLALLRDEDSVEDKMIQRDISDEDLERVLDRSDLIPRPLCAIWSDLLCVLLCAVGGAWKVLRMPRPMHRGVSGTLISEASNEYGDSHMQNDDFDKAHSSNQSYISLKFPVRLVLSETNSPSKNGSSRNVYIPEIFSSITSRSRHKLAIGFLRISLVIIVLLTLSGSFWWSLHISTSSRGTIVHGYRRLQEQLVSDMRDIGKISLASTRLKELSFCPEEYENYVPCFNLSNNLASGFSDGNEYDRDCGHELRQNCIVLPPKNYRIPLRWPTGRDVIWATNVKISAQEVLSSRSMTKRMMMMEEEQISFRSVSLVLDSVEDYSHQIAEMLGLRNESGLTRAGVRTILDIGCGYGSFGAHLFSKGLLTMCIAPYEASGSQVQLTLERGLPAMIGSFSSKQLPYPSLSFDMLHCSRCGFDWYKKDGFLLLEMDRVLRPGGYFVWTSPLTNSQSLLRNKANEKKWTFIRTFAETICWDLLSQQDETVVWMKTSKKKCYTARRPGDGPATCSKDHDISSPYYQSLQSCIGGTESRRWIPIEQRATWPSRAYLNSTELAIHGVHSKDIAEDTGKWNIALQNYWSLLSPLLFSDHPKRPGDEDPSPPFNMLRNVLDMNARYGGFNSALLDAGKSVWVMNVIPTTGHNYLPLIVDRGFIGVFHDWCEAFPTYPRTYDLVHADGLLSLQSSQHRCTVLDVLTEIDRILRPEGWVIIRDYASVIESSRALTTQLKWDARLVEIENNNEEKLLICQKPFIKGQ